MWNAEKNGSVNGIVVNAIVEQNPSTAQIGMLFGLPDTRVAWGVKLLRTGRQRSMNSTDQCWMRHSPVVDTVWGGNLEYNTCK